MSRTGAQTAVDQVPDMDFDEDVTACAALVERADPDRFAAVMAAPAERRPALFAIYAFNVEVSRAPWVTQEPMIAQMRLQWWRDVLDEIRGGGPVRRHEVASPLSRVLDQRGAELLEQVIDARERDVERAAFADTQGVLDYVDNSSGALLVAATRTLGPASEDLVRVAGRAQGMANFLRAVPALHGAGWRALPDDAPETITALARAGLEDLHNARAGRRDVSRAARPALLGIWQTGPVLRRAVRAPARVAAGTLDPAPVARRLSLIWSAATGRW